MNKILEFFQDNSGGLSSIRLLMLISVLGVFITWGAISYYKKELQPLPESITTILGVIVSGKVVQRFGEKETTTSPQITE